MQGTLFEMSTLIQPSFRFSFSAYDASLLRKSSIVHLTCSSVHGYVDQQLLNKGKQYKVIPSYLQGILL